MKSPNSSQKRVCIISLTQVTQEPRVLRQIRTFREKGWAVSVIGYPGRVPPPADWEFFDARTTPAPQPEKKTLAAGDSAEPLRIRHMIYKHPRRAARLLIKALVIDPLRVRRNKARRKLRATRLAFFIRIYDRARTPGAGALTRALARRLTTMSSRQAHEKYWSYYAFRIVRDTILDKVSRCDLVIGHDYFTYPLAGMLAKKYGARLALDCHEYARGQYNHDDHPDIEARYDWLFVARPLCDALQSEYYRKADAVSTVSDGIADLLQEDYALQKRPTVIRSTPFYEELPFRPCGETIEVLYHGVIDQSRNLDACVRSVPLWRPEFHFVIRGPQNLKYEAELRTLAQQLGVQDRVTIEPPVAFSDLVKAANGSDVGYCIVENYSAQRQFAAPNKFFEYMMAGLALVFTDTTEQAKIINTYGNGLLVGSLDPKIIADAINSLTPDKINAMKKHSLAAAKELCWERESVKLIEAYGITS